MLASTFNPIETVLLSVWGFIYYLKLFIYPYTLVLFHKISEPVSILDPHYSIPVLALFLIIYSLFLFKKNRIYIFAFAFYAISIFLLLTFPDEKDAQIVTNRFIYMPSLGFCVLIGYVYHHVLSRVENSQWKRICLNLTGLMVIAVMMGKTIGQCQVWQSSVTLWEHQLKHNPNVVPGLIYQKLGSAYLDEGKRQIKEAIEFQKRAIAINPYSMTAYYELGRAYKKSGDIDQAVYYYKQPSLLEPNNPEGFYHLGKFYQEINREEDAVKAFSKTIQLQPKNRNTYYNVLRAYDEALASGSMSQLYRLERKTTEEAFEGIFDESPGNVMLK